MADPLVAYLLLNKQDKINNPFYHFEEAAKKANRDKPQWFHSSTPEMNDAEDAEFEVIEPKIICGMKVTDERWQKTEDIECEVIPPKAIGEGKENPEPSVARMPK